MHEPLLAWVDKEPLEKRYAPIQSGTLTLMVLPAVFSGYPPSAYPDLYLFETPFDNFDDSPWYFDRLADEIVDLGDIPTLIGYRREEITVPLKERHLYDTIVLGNTPRGREVIYQNRLATGQILPFPYGLTLDETKLLALEYGGFTPEQMKGKKGKIVSPATFTDREHLLVWFELVDK